jgi:hypothetical protein
VINNDQQQKWRNKVNFESTELFNKAINEKGLVPSINPNCQDNCFECSLDCQFKPYHNEARNKVIPL